VTERHERIKRFHERRPDAVARPMPNAGDAGPANSQSMTPTIAPSSIRKFLGSQSPWVNLTG